ncbi:hypothetical protein [Streptomyces sp. NPDC002685]|uniref:hypothetical protein n=1 Tax=Streptomyces sp. NPDC002685 TaxID=3154540 RepID=UPI003324A319
MTDTDIPEPVRQLLVAVLEAIDIPHPATFGHQDAYDRLLNDRVMYARLALRSTPGDAELGPAMGPAWDARYLRDRLAQHPITGYVTVDQADAALNEGKTWAEAVALPAGEDQ